MSWIQQKNLHTHQCAVSTRTDRFDLKIMSVTLNMLPFLKPSETFVAPFGFLMNYPPCLWVLRLSKTFIFWVYFLRIVIAGVLLTGWDAAGSRDEKRSSGGHKTPHIKKRSHEDRGTNSHNQQPQYHAKTSDGPGFISHSTSTHIYNTPIH